MTRRRRYQIGGFGEEDPDFQGPPEPEDLEIGQVGEGQDVESPTGYIGLNSPSKRQQELISRMEASSEQVRAALQRARERIMAREYDPSLRHFANAEALSAPTRSGSFGETLSNLAGAQREDRTKKQDFDIARDKDLLDTEIAIGGVDAGVLKAELELEKLRRGYGSHSNNELEMWDELTRNMTPAQIDSAARRKLGLESKAGTFSVRMVNGVPTLVGVGMGDDDAEPGAYNLPLSTLLTELNAKGGAKGAEAIGTELGKQYSALQEGIPQTQQRLDKLDRLEGLLAGVETGTLTPIEIKASGVLEYFGLPPLDDDLDSKQAAMALTNEIALQNRNPAGGAGMPGSMSDADRQFLTNMGPNLSQTPQGRKLVMDTSRKLAKRSLEVAAFARAYKKKNGTFDEYFYDELQAWADAHPLFSAPPKTPDQLSPEQQAELARKLAERAQPARKRGGYVRRYQKGGLVTLDDGTQVLVPGDDDDEPTPPTTGGKPPPKKDQSILGSLREMAEPLLEGAAGFASGLGLEELVSRLVGRSATGLDKSERQVLRAFENDRVDPVQAADELKRGQRQGVPLQLGDVGGPYTNTLADNALTSMSPEEAMGQLDQMQARHDAGRERVESQFNKGLKPYDYFAHHKKLQENLYANAKPLYEAAYAKGAGIKMSPELNAILDTATGKRAVANAAKLMETYGKPIGRADVTGMVQRPSLEFLDYVKRGFDQSIESAEPNGVPSTEGRALRDQRRRFMTLLDAAAPPEYKLAREQYAGDLEVRDALEEGRMFHKFQPEELAERAKGLSFAERNAYRTGMAQKIHEIIMSPSTDTNQALKMVGSPLTLQRLEPFFDSPGAFKVFQEALKKEVELFDHSKQRISRGEKGLENRAAAEYNGGKALKTIAGGVRAVTSPLGTPMSFVLRMIADRPKMSEKEAARVIEILRRNNPQELANFARRAATRAKIMKYRTPRRLATAAAGAGAALALGADDEE